MILPLLAVVTAQTVALPPGETHLHKPFEPRGVSIQGHPSGSTLVMDPDFDGAAAIVLEQADHVTLSGFTIRGNRAAMKSGWYLPPDDVAFADFYKDNGILARGTTHLTVRDVTISGVRAFAVLASAGSDVKIEHVKVTDSGTLQSNGRNNTTGGILLEQGVQRFEVAQCSFLRVAGTAIWTHSTAQSERNGDGSIHDNTVRFVGRDAIQVGHAAQVEVRHNSGAMIGYPASEADVEHFGTPVALDTAGNVDASSYRDNRFTDVNGECINLDGFHDGEVTGNSCVNDRPLAAYPWSHYGAIFGNHDPAASSSGIVFRGNVLRGFAYGGIYVVGSGNRIEGNRMSRLNLARCGLAPVTALCNYALDQPDLLRSGIYLAADGGRAIETRGNVVSGNTASGFGIAAHCVTAAPGVSLAQNQAGKNLCR